MKRARLASREQHVAEFCDNLRLSGSCSAGVRLCWIQRRGSDRGTEFLDFFFNLAKNLIEAFCIVRPIEAGA